MKKIRLQDPLYDLVKTYPELVDILASLGFTAIKKPILLNSVGKIMTIPKGAALKSLSLPTIIESLQEKGFEIIDEKELLDGLAPEKNKQTNNFSRNELLKSYLNRLNSGESLKTVQEDFRNAFDSVEAIEIMKAEEALIEEGTPLDQMQRLCDLHSTLFHGCTVLEQKKEQNNFEDNRIEESTSLSKMSGHPLHTLTLENSNLINRINEIRKKIEDKKETVKMLVQLQEVFTHYAKKGDLLYPLLKVNYHIIGPFNVMWSVDDEIRDQLKLLSKTPVERNGWEKNVLDLLMRMEEMVYKETNILFPLCETHFSSDEWKQIYQDAKGYESCLGITPSVWDEGENSHPAYSTSSHQENEILMPGGHMNVEEITALLNTIPLEITFVDANGINKFFNEGPKVFKRPTMAIDRDVFSCHPPKVEQRVRGIIESFRKGTQDRIPIWMEKNGKTMLVTYMAVRNKEGKFLGTLELVQEMESIKNYFASKNKSHSEKEGGDS